MRNAGWLTLGRSSSEALLVGVVVLRTGDGLGRFGLDWTREASEASWRLTDRWAGRWDAKSETVPVFLFKFFFSINTIVV